MLFFFEAVDVFANCVEHAALTADRLDVFALKVARILTFKGSLHGTDVAQHITDGFNVLATLKNASTAGSDISIIGVDIPSTPDDVFKSCQRYEIFDQRRAVFGALAKTDCAHLSERTNGLTETALGEFDASDQGRSHSTEADGQDTEAASGRKNEG